MLVVRREGRRRDQGRCRDASGAAAARYEVQAIDELHWAERLPSHARLSDRSSVSPFSTPRRPRDRPHSPLALSCSSIALYCPSLASRSTGGLIALLRSYCSGSSWKLSPIARSGESRSSSVGSRLLYLCRDLQYHSSPLPFQQSSPSYGSPHSSCRRSRARYRFRRLSPLSTNAALSVMLLRAYTQLISVQTRQVRRAGRWSAAPSALTLVDRGFLSFLGPSSMAMPSWVRPSFACTLSIEPEQSGRSDSRYSSSTRWTWPMLFSHASQLSTVRFTPYF